MTANRFVTRGGRLPRPEGLSNQASSRKAIVLIHSYGKKACNADRLPAQELDDAILERLAAVLEQEPLVREAIEEAFAELDSERPKREAEVKRIERELHSVDRALDRYFAPSRPARCPSGPVARGLRSSAGGWPS